MTSQWDPGQGSSQGAWTWASITVKRMNCMSTSCLQTHSTLYPSSSFAVGKKLRPRGKMQSVHGEPARRYSGQKGENSWALQFSVWGHVPWMAGMSWRWLSFPGSSPGADRSGLQGGWQLGHLKRTRGQDSRTPHHGWLASRDTPHLSQDLWVPSSKGRARGLESRSCHGTPLLVEETPDTTLLCDPQHFRALSTCERLPTLLGTWPLPSSKSAVVAPSFHTE